MDTWVWVTIIVALLLAVYLWNKYGAIYTAITNNPEAVHAGLAINRYATDIEGLVGAADAANDTQGSFMSRLGAFFGAMPT